MTKEAMEFALNRCPLKPGQMMTPDKDLVAESCPRQPSKKRTNKTIHSARESGLSGPFITPEGRSARVPMTKYWMVGIGGFIGSVLRFWVGAYFGNRFGTRFPLRNIFLHQLHGILSNRLDHDASCRAHTHWNANWRYLIPIGFLGGVATDVFDLRV